VLLTDNGFVRSITPSLTKNIKFVVFFNSDVTAIGETTKSDYDSFTAHLDIAATDIQPSNPNDYLYFSIYLNTTELNLVAKIFREETEDDTIYTFIALDGQQTVFKKSDLDRLAERRVIMQLFKGIKGRFED